MSDLFLHAGKHSEHIIIFIFFAEEQFLPFFGALAGSDAALFSSAHQIKSGKNSQQHEPCADQKYGLHALGELEKAGAEPKKDDKAGDEGTGCFDGGDLTHAFAHGIRLCQRHADGIRKRQEQVHALRVDIQEQQHHAERRCEQAQHRQPCAGKHLRNEA